jgi:hypothetical protein
MFAEFSKHYLLGTFEAFPDTRRSAAMNNTQYQQTLNQVAGPPIVMKSGESSFAVYGDDRVPYGELAISVDLLNTLPISLGFNPEPQTFFVARNEHAKQLTGF